MMYAVAEFGSRSRNTSDSISDRDLLIVSPMKHRRALHKKYSSEGYSVTLLSEKQLLYMRGSGSLFLQHLKNEASIWIDSGAKLRLFLDQCQLISPTSVEIEKCKSTLKYISQWPDSADLSAWKADFLFCVSRDYLIKRLAIKKRLAFGLEGITRETRQLFSTSDEEMGVFHALRQAKAAYRGDGAIPAELARISKRWLAVMHHRFGVNLAEAYATNVLDDIHTLADRLFASRYERLRTLEALYLLARNNGCIHPDHSRLIKYIVQPNFYRSSQKCKQEMVHRYLLEVIPLVATNAIQRTHFPLRYAALQMRR